MYLTRICHQIATGETLLIPVAVLQSHLSKTVTASLFADFENGFHLTWLHISQDAHCVTTKQALTTHTTPQKNQSQRINS